MAATFTKNDAAIRRLISPSGPIGRDAMRRARRVESTGKRLAPVDSGRMRSTIHIDGPETTGLGFALYVVASTHYARYVHDGTRYMRARPFLADAVSAAFI